MHGARRCGTTKTRPGYNDWWWFGKGAWPGQQDTIEQTCHLFDTSSYNIWMQRHRFARHEMKKEIREVVVVLTNTKDQQRADAIFCDRDRISR
jgi:hypothetical protein